MNGKLIVIEGLDGSGKNTQTKLLVDFLSANGKNVEYLSFPDYSSPSSALVKMYLNSEFGSSPSDVNAYAAASFFAVDRFASFKKSWEKSYKNGKILICDRYTTSNTFYQMSKLPKRLWNEYLTWLYDYEYNKLGLPKPSSVIYLNMPVSVSQNLMEKRYHGDENQKDLHESNVAFLKKCEEAANYVRKKDSWFTVDCVFNESIKNKDQIHSEITAFLRKDIFDES